MPASPSISLWRRLSAFGGLSLLAAFSPLLVLPVIARNVSPSVWSSLLSCQALGAFAGLLILSGWGVNGQAHVAAAVDHREQDVIYRASVSSRIKMSAITLPICIASGLYLSGGAAPVTHALMCVSAAWSAGFTLNWFAVGSGRPDRIAVYDLTPRVVAAAGSAAIIYATGAIWVYPTLIIVCLAIGLTIFHRRELRTWLPWGQTTLPNLGAAERMRGGAVSLVGAAYSSAPLPVAHVLSLAGAPALASADRLYRYALFSVSSLGNALQQWVVRDRTKLSAHYTALWLHAALGAIGGTTIALLGPIGGRILFGADVAPPYEMCAGYGIAFFFVSMSTPLVRNILVPANRTHKVLQAGIVSGAAAVTLMVAIGSVKGATGVAWSLACGDFICFLLLVPTARRVIRQKL